MTVVPSQTWQTWQIWQTWQTCVAPCKNLLAGLYLCLAMSCTSAFAVEPILSEATWLRRPQDVIETEHLRIILPRSLPAEHSRRLALRAERLYRALLADAGPTASKEPLWLLFNNDADVHNGFSAQVPHPLVQVDLKPAEPDSGIFDGVDHVDRTLIHEFAHHLSNDRQRWAARWFGRVVPGDPLSFGMYLLTVPNHATMPSFWQEGLAQWAESSYLLKEQEGSYWRGRGSDSLTHMIWRLDAAADAIPPIGEWRLSYHRWPFGNRSYLYGAAYMRDLVATHKINPWEVIVGQADRPIYSFNGGAVATLGKHHTILMQEARERLLKEQKGHIETIKQQGLTDLARLHDDRYLAGPPAWTSTGVMSIMGDRYGRTRLHTFSTSGDHKQRQDTSTDDHLRITDDLLVHSRLDGRGRAEVVLYDHRLQRYRRLSEPRLRQPHAIRQEDGYLLAGIAYAADGSQAMELHQVNARARPQERIGHWAPAGKRLWSPALHRDANGKIHIACLATDKTGSQLLVWPADEAGAEARALWTVRGRLNHPCWSADGKYLYVCSDRSGVFNAYRITVKDGTVRPITNVIGGVLACTPSPSGLQLALQHVDRNGPHLALIANDEANWPDTIPEVPIIWQTNAKDNDRSIPALPAGDELEVKAYNPWQWTEFSYWTPTATVSSRGEAAYGLAALFTDPLTVNRLKVSAGVSGFAAEPVGTVDWTWSTLPVDLHVIADRRERHYASLLQTQDGAEWDYTETRTGIAAGISRTIPVASDEIVPQIRLFAGWDYWREAESDLPSSPRPVTPPPFTGHELYIEAGLRLSDLVSFPDGFAASAGWLLDTSWRSSGFGGDLSRNQLLASGRGFIPLWREQDHKLVINGQVGWSDGDDFLQSNFAVGTGFQRATGQHLVATEIGYQFPVYRPFDYFSTSPWVHRSLILMPFYNAAKVSDDHPGGDGDWYQSIGLDLRTSWEFDGAILAPGLRFGKELDHDKDFYFGLILGL